MLGAGLDRPVDAVVCWTPDGQIVGGTGIAVLMAGLAGVPVLNLAVQSPREACLFLRKRRHAFQSRARR